MKLETARLMLREFVEDDWRDVLAYQSDPRYLRFYEWTQRTEADVRTFVQWFLDNQREVPRIKRQLGMIEEGRLRDHSFYEDRYWDTLLFGLMKSEWCEQRYS